MDEKLFEKLLNQIKLENDDKFIIIPVPSFLGKRLEIYNSMRSDLIMIKDATNLILKGINNQVIVTSLWHTIISLYGKCFIDATKSKSSKLEPNDCFDKSDKLFEIHENLMYLRHNFVAHRGVTDNEIGMAYIKLEKNKEKDFTEVRVNRLKRIMPKKEELNDYLTLFDYLISIIESKFQKQAEKVRNDMFKLFTPEQLSMIRLT